MFRRSALFLFALFLLFSSGSLSAAQLVKSGKSVSYILLSPDAGKVEKHAAKELSFFIKKQTGADLVSSTEKIPGKSVISFISADSKNLKMTPALAKAVKNIRHDGFILYSGRDFVRIIAKEKRGFLYGVYRILTDFGGIYWLFPGEYGEFIPRKNSFRVPEMCKNYNPAFSQRKFRLNGGSGWTPETYDWLLRNGLQVFCTMITNRKDRADYMAERDAIFSDGDGGLVPIMGSSKGYNKKAWASLQKAHPEYFGFRNGKYCAPMQCQPCTSNKAVRELILKHSLEKLSRYPADRTVSWVMSNDDHTNWCECKNCLALDDPGDDRSNNRATRWWHLVNFLVPRILEKYKNVRIEAFAYQNFRFPPAKLAPVRDASVMICPHGRCYLHTLDDPSCPANASKFREMFDAWARIGIGGTTFEYHPEMPGKVHYLFHERSWVKDLQYYHKLKMYGFGMVVTAPTDFYKYHSYGRKRFYSLRNSWEAHWQRYFLTGYYSWNIDADFDAISEKINSLWYGKTWKVMKKYRQELINALYDSRVHMGYGTPTSVLGKCYERPGLAQKVAAYFAEAFRLAKGDKVLEKRIARDQEFFKVDWEEAFKAYAKGKQKEYNARKRSGRIVIDGKFDEMDWKEASFGTDFLVFNEKQEIKADPQTFVKILYDADTLYFAIEGLKEKGAPLPVSVPQEDGLRALDGAHFEIFITPSSWNGKYYQLGFSQNGKLYQALTTSGSSRDFSLKVDPEFKCVDYPDKWVLEAKVDLAKLGIKISDGSVWKINIARSAAKKDGKYQASSWSTNGVFHGSDVHRSVAFGSAGAVLRNGDAEDLVPFKAPRFKKNPNRPKWVFADNMVPKYWSFNENNIGKGAVKKDSPASGKYYMMIEGTNAFTDLYMNEPDKKPARYAVTLSARGKGELFVSVRTDGKYSKAKNSSIKPLSATQWSSYTLVIDAPAVRRGSRVLALRVTGRIDVDNIQVQRIPEEEIPDAEKHK